jgi:hypothetical protein
MTTVLFRFTAFVVMAYCCAPALADDRRFPDEKTAAVLAKKGISYAEWLLYDGIRAKNGAHVLQALSAGADANLSRDFWPYPAQSPLMAALYSGGQPEIVEALIKAGANVNFRFTGTSSTNVEQLNTAQKAYLAAVDAAKDKRTKEFFPLYYAVDTNPRTVALLLDAGADPNAIGGSASQAIFKTRDIEIARLLVAHGASVNAKNFEGETVLANAKRELRSIWKGHYLYDKIERYCAWLESVGGHE